MIFHGCKCCCYDSNVIRLTGGAYVGGPAGNCVLVVLGEVVCFLDGGSSSSEISSMESGHC